MRWDLEELVENVVAQYLKVQVNAEVNVYRAWDFEEPKFPCVVVHAAESGPISEPAAWHDARTIRLEASVMCEAAPDTNDSGETVITARDRNAKARSKVLEALCVSDLVTQLNAIAAADADGLAVDMAQVTTVQRIVSEVDRVLVSVINIEVIAEPVTGSAYHAN